LATVPSWLVKRIGQVLDIIRAGHATASAT